MAKNPCLDIVRRDVGDLSPEELDSVLAEMGRRQRAYIGQGLPAQEAAQKAAKTVGSDLKLAAAIERRNAAINLHVRLEALDFVRTQFADNPGEGINALLAGSNKAGLGTRMSADAVQHALKGQYIGGLVGDLERSGLLEIFAEGGLDIDVARALWAIDSPDALAKLPKTAVQIAKVVRRWQEKARIDANRAGAWVGKIDGYIARQGHDADKVLKAGFKKWSEVVLPRLDLARMFPDGIPHRAELDRYLDEAYAGIVSGIHESLPTSADKMAGFTGPGNLARKQSQSRKLHFKSADDWSEYNKTFGPGNLRESVLLGLQRSADATGVMRVLGTNPEYNIQAIYDALRGELRKARNFEALKELDTKGNPGKGWGKALLQDVMGRSGAAAGRTLATAGSVVRGVNAMTSLGGAVLSAVTDVPLRAMEMQYQGQNFLEHTAKGLLAPFQRLVESTANKAERRAMLAELGQFSDSMTGLLGARFSAADNLPGQMARAQRLFFKVSFLTGWTDIQRDSAILATSAHFGSLASSAFGELPEAATRLLKQYGIGEAEWTVLRGATRTMSDKPLLSPEAVRELDARQFSELAGEQINAVKAGTVGRIQRRMAADEKERGWVSKRADKLQEQLREAHSRLDERLKGAEGKTSEAINDLKAGISKLEEQIEFASSYWEAKAGGDAPGIDAKRSVRFYGKRKLRDLGVDEGKALEAMKSIRAESKALTKSLDRLKKDLNEDFIARWSDRQDDLSTFADGVDERIRTRAEDSAKDLGDVGPRIQRILEDKREDVAVKLQTMLTDRMNYAVITPDARTRAATTWGQQRGTAAGEIARAVMQFKSFGIAFSQRTLGREMFGYGARRLRDMRSQELRGMAQLIASTTAFGYLAIAAKDLVKGKKPRPTDDWKTWVASMQQGGGFGIYGDFLFGEASRFGQGPIATLAGPTVGKTEDLIRLMWAAKNGEDPSAKAFRFAVSNTPFINLFWTKLAFDYAIFWRIQEAMNPGYLRRTERRVRKQNDQEYWLKPTSVQ